MNYGVIDEISSKREFKNFDNTVKERRYKNRSDALRPAARDQVRGKKEVKA
ncbi:MAG: hypothetical protein BTN85_2202 [Candidatus Methanohalarchaeum thermophilum]|uniref:Uncharacterized protein n=1 Tax=Methanohalarchaeum thermophilum TaxID=1903181 RepID=A0A1Q6DRT0_METT1|nr:MAG: hypothetical protein BTN85_2202 [Candidatus Methanohalarchaeum thermophilum]